MADFYAKCANPSNVEYVLVVHVTRWSAAIIEEFEGFDWGAVAVIVNHGADNCVSQGNTGAAHCTGEIIVSSMDDLFPPKHWDALLGEAMLFSSGEVIHVSSGSPSDDKVFIPQIQARKRYERIGYAGHPAYESMYVDNEFTDLARRDGTVIEARHIKFEHRHPALGTGQMDAIYSQENRREAYVYGARVYEARKALGFPTDPAWRLPEVQPDSEVSIACSLPGELFGEPWVWGWTRLYGHLMRERSFNNVSVLFGHTTNVYCTRMEHVEMLAEVKPRPHFVLWLDDDNILEPDQFDWLYHDLQLRPDVAGVVGWCWCDNSGKDPEKPWLMSCGRQGDDLAMLPFHPNDLSGGPLVPIDWSGFPCVLLRYEVLEALGKEAFAPIVRPDVKYGFTSEDTSFFFRAKEAGFKFLVDLRVKVPHIKMRAIEPQYVPRPKAGEHSQHQAVAAD